MSELLCNTFLGDCRTNAEDFLIICACFFIVKNGKQKHSPVTR